MASATLEEAIMSGIHFPLSVAMVCGNCLAVFRVQPACPACTSEHIQAIETWLTRRRDERQRTEFVSRVEDEMHRLIPRRST